jgi:hypothetical protein
MKIYKSSDLIILKRSMTCVEISKGSERRDNDTQLKEK